MKHVYGFLFMLIGLAGIGMALLCPIVRGTLAFITFIVGCSLLNLGARAVGITNDKDDPI